MSEQKPSIGDVAREAGEAARGMAEKAFKGLKDFGTRVADGSKDFMASAKLSGQQNDLHKEIEQAYRKLGELAYQNGNLTGEMGKVAQEIHDLYAKLQTIEMKRNET